MKWHAVGAPRLAGGDLTLKLLLTLCAAAILLVISLQRPATATLATFLLGLSVIATSFADYFGYVFRGLQRVELNAALIPLRVC